MSGFTGMREVAPPQAPVAAAAPLPVVSGLSPGERLQAALRALRWTYGTLAVELRTSASTTRNWGLGRSPVPAALLAWLEELAAYHAARPLPALRGGSLRGD